MKKKVLFGLGIIAIAAILVTGAIIKVQAHPHLDGPPNGTDYCYYNSTVHDCKCSGGGSVCYSYTCSTSCR